MKKYKTISAFFLVVNIIELGFVLLFGAGALFLGFFLLMFSGVDGAASTEGYVFGMWATFGGLFVIALFSCILQLRNLSSIKKSMVAKKIAYIFGVISIIYPLILFGVSILHDEQVANKKNEKAISIIRQINPDMFEVAIDEYNQATNYEGNLHFEGTYPQCKFSKISDYTDIVNHTFERCHEAGKAGESIDYIQSNDNDIYTVFSFNDLRDMNDSRLIDIFAAGCFGKCYQVKFDDDKSDVIIQFNYYWNHVYDDESHIELDNCDSNKVIYHFVNDKEYEDLYNYLNDIFINGDNTEKYLTISALYYTLLGHCDKSMVVNFSLPKLTL